MQRHDKAWNGMERKEKGWHGNTRHGMERKVNERHGMAWDGKEGMEGQGKAGHGKE